MRAIFSPEQNKFSKRDLPTGALFFQFFVSYRHRRDVLSQELASSLNGGGVPIAEAATTVRRGIFYPKTCDVTDEQAVTDAFAWADVHLGGVSVLVNNAGIVLRTSLLGKPRNRPSRPLRIAVFLSIESIIFIFFLNMRGAGSKGGVGERAGELAPTVLIDHYG